MLKVWMFEEESSQLICLAVWGEGYSVSSICFYQRTWCTGVLRWRWKGFYFIFQVYWTVTFGTVEEKGVVWYCENVREEWGVDRNLEIRSSGVNVIGSRRDVDNFAEDCWLECFDGELVCDEILEPQGRLTYVRLERYKFHIGNWIHVRRFGGRW